MRRCGAVLKREADGVGDLAAGDFVIADEAWEDGQTCRVGGGPGEWALRVVLQIPNGGGSGVPRAVGIDAGTKEFVEPAVVVIEDEDVAVAGTRIGVALDVGVGGNGHGAGITFVAVSVEEDVHGRLRRADDGIRNADVAALNLTGAKVGMERDGGTDEIDVGVGIWIGGRSRNVLIPCVACGEGTEAVKTYARAGTHSVAGAGLRSGSDLEIYAGGGALAGVGIADGDGEDAGSGGVSGGGELCGGNVGCVERDPREKDLRAAEETAAGDD